MPRAKSDAPPSSAEVSISLTTTVFDKLRSDILAGKLAPGEKLRLEHLTARYGSGRTPLREACSRLAAEGLVLASEQRGFRVAPISRDDLLDLTRTRQRVETLALRDAIFQGDQRWEDGVRAALDALNTLPRRRPGHLLPSWETAHRRFHDALLAGCQSVWLRRFHTQLYDQTERYRRMSEVLGGQDRDVDGEHAALATAALARDPERAAALLTEHIAKTAELVLRGHPALRGTEAAEAVRPTPRMSTKRRARDGHS